MTATTLTPILAGNPVSYMAAAFRFAAALGIAIVVTLGLFLLMQALIWVEVSSPEPVAERPSIEISMVPPDEPIVRTPPTPPVDVVVPPAITPLPISQSELPGESVTTGPIEVIQIDPDTSNMARITRLPPPISVRIPPVYPAREADRGIEGSCVIQYDILGNGRTANARALACDSSGFARASLAAVAQWRHATVQGDAPNAVIQQGVQTRLDFQLEG